MARHTLGGGYGPLIGRFGLALDNLLAAEVVLADGRIVTAERGREEDLFWALRGSGGNFGVVTAMCVRLHEVPNVVSGVLVYPFSEAKTVLRRLADTIRSMPDELTVQVGAIGGPDGMPVILLVPTWCGFQAEGDARIAPLFELGTLLDNTADAIRYGTSICVFDPHIVSGHRTFMDTCWLPHSMNLESTFWLRPWRGSCPPDVQSLATSSEAQPPAEPGGPAVAWQR